MDRAILKLSKLEIVIHGDAGQRRSIVIDDYRREVN